MQFCLFKQKIEFYLHIQHQQKVFYRKLTELFHINNKYFKKINLFYIKNILKKYYIQINQKNHHQ